MTVKPLPTATSVELIDAHIEMPRNGQAVLALGAGGVMVKTVWNSHSIEFFEAWCPHPKVPDSVKNRMTGRHAPKVVI